MYTEADHVILLLLLRWPLIRRELRLLRDSICLRCRQGRSLRGQVHTDHLRPFREFQVLSSRSRCRLHAVFLFRRNVLPCRGVRVLHVLLLMLLKVLLHGPLNRLRDKRLLLLWGFLLNQVFRGHVHLLLMPLKNFLLL